MIIVPQKEFTLLSVRVIAGLIVIALFTAFALLQGALKPLQAIGIFLLIAIAIVVSTFYDISMARLFTLLRQNGMMP